MSISKRALGVEGFEHSTPRPEPTFEEIQKWVPIKVNSFILTNIEFSKNKIRIFYKDYAPIAFTMKEIDEAANQQKYMENEIRRILQCN